MLICQTSIKAFSSLRARTKWAEASALKINQGVTTTVKGVIFVRQHSVNDRIIAHVPLFAVRTAGGGVHLKNRSKKWQNSVKSVFENSSMELISH